jgi:hypothetical protein
MPGGAFCAPEALSSQTGHTMSTKKKNKFKPEAFAAETKDTRFEGTFEVLIPIPDRVKPLRAAQQFPSKKAAEDWIHSPEGVERIEELFAKGAN